MDSATSIKDQPDRKQVLAKAVLNAGKSLGLTQTDIADIIGRDRSVLKRSGLDPNSKPGELALLLVRVYRSVYALVGGDHDAIRHWFQTRNKYFEETPRDLVTTAEGLVRVTQYLDAMRGHT
ncbi:MbcA/ParS/Xre antitoxin family protein [Marinobacter caseinilyticus]|uniref:MbcA/ParS/Xre antitoxin family protein n=1 Tax=Marinobacter caseinilyticus TaxID=2692195 RepID=UPI0014083ED5|nr:MbcA/ParS/Xre antitoxin family protein [Marinobacter caseinilyticus]